MRGIVLAGGNGTRLRPLTQIANKHLLPIYNQPMIMYPLNTLKHLGISDILIVSGGENIGTFAEFLEDGHNFGVNLTYKVQIAAGGIAQALSLAEDFANGEDIAVILGDNIFEDALLELPKDSEAGEAILFCKDVPDPERFGVANFGEDGKILSIEEKPKQPKSNWAVTGLYIYPPEVFNIIPFLKPSSRGELEITDVNNYFVQEGKCRAMLYGGSWNDAGTFDSMLKSSIWAKQEVEKRENIS